MDRAFEHYESLFNNVPCGIGLFPISGDQHALYLNSTYYDLIGYTEEEYRSISVDPITLLIYEDDREHVRTLLTDPENNPVESEYRIVRKDGTLVWIKLNTTQAEAEGRDLVLASFVDITKEKELEDRLMLIMESVAYSISILRVEDGRPFLEYTNDTFRKLTGYPIEQYSSDTMGWTRRSVGQDVFDRMDALICTALSTGQPQVIEYQFRRKDGGSIWLRRRFSVIASSGCGSYRLLSVTEDITEQKMAQEEIALRDEAMCIVDRSLSAGTIINSLALDKPLLYISDNIVDFLGYTKDEFQQMYRNQYADVIYPEDYEHVVELNVRYAHERPKSYEMEFRFIRKDGSTFWTLEKGTFIKDFRGDPAYLSVFIDITAQKHTEMELYERNAMFDLLLEHSNLSMWTYDIATNTARLISSKKHVRPISEEGTPDYPEALLSQGYFKQSSKEQVRELMRQVDAGATTVSSDIWYSPKGAAPWCDNITYINITDDDGTIIRTVGIAEDVTEQRLAQQRYEAELDHLQGLYGDNLITKLLCNLSRNSVESAFSDYPELILRTGSTYDECAEMLVDASCTSEDRRRVRGFLEASTIIHAFEQGESSRHIECRQRLVQKQVIWVDYSTRVYRDMQTGDIKCFIYITDISREHVTQDIINRVAELNFDYIGCLDLENDSYTLFTGEGIEKLPQPLQTGTFEEAMRAFVKACVAPQDVDRMTEMMSRDTILKGLDATERLTFTASIREPSGEQTYKRFEFFYLSRENQQVITTRTDITNVIHEEQRQRELLEDALSQARQASVAKSAFLSSMSHDIRTPMNAIVNMTNFALAVPSNPPETNGYLSAVAQSSTLLLHLVNDLLDMSRIESGNTSIARSPFDLIECLDGVFQIVSPLSMEKNQTFTMDYSNVAHTKLIGDKLKLSQVLINLLNNAVKFTPEDGCISLVAEESDALRPGYAPIGFSVTDNGIGIPGENLELIFKPFVRVENESVRNTEGSGLGLAICRSYIELMGGSLTVDSKPDEGSVFTIEISFKEDRQAPSTPMHEIPPRETCSHDFTGRHALLVEDNEINRIIAAKLLEESGFTIEYAIDGDEAVRIFTDSAEGCFDIVYMDIQMPIKNGCDAARDIRASHHPQAMTIPIIAMTANAFVEDVERSHEAGMNAHIGKPLSRDELMAVTAKMLCDV